MFITLLFFALAPAHARETLRPTAATQLLIGVQRDVGVRVRTARVVAFNRRRLVEMFPPLGRASDSTVQRWILDHAAYVNTRQLVLTGVRNTEIDCDAKDRVVFHVAPGAGRGADIEVEGQIINLKASGNSVWNQVQTAEQRRWADLGRAAEVRHVHHASGLETFSVAAAEYLRQLEIHQSSYSGARVDFGGARTPREARVSYEARVARLGPGRTGEFIARAAARLLEEPVPEREPSPARAATRILRGPPGLRNRFIEPRVLGLPYEPGQSDFSGETPASARLKARLFALTPVALERWLAALDDDALIELFASARGSLKMPLPEAAYHHGLRRAPSVRDGAAAAARVVIDRFPALRDALFAEARAALRRPRAAPDFVRELLTVDDAGDGLAEFVIAAAASRHPVFRKLATARVAQTLKLAAHHGPKIDVTNRAEWPNLCDAPLGGER